MKSPIANKTSAKPSNSVLPNLPRTTEAQKAKTEAEQANSAESQFLANMSHELRTPLNIILGFTQLMTRKGSSAPQQQGYLDTISRSGEYLLTPVS